MAPITAETLRAYLADALPDTEMAAVEKALRDDPTVQARFAEVRQGEDRGEHSVGAVWRRERLSCPGREQLGGYLLEALDPDLLDYIRFHLETVGCPFCRANLDDLQKLHAEPPAPRAARRKRIVDSSAGMISQKR